MIPGNFCRRFNHMWTTGLVAFVVVITMAILTDSYLSPLPWHSHHRHPMATSFIGRQKHDLAALLLERRSSSRLHFFGRNKEDDDSTTSDDKPRKTMEGNEESSTMVKEKKPFSIPFFGRAETGMKSASAAQDARTSQSATVAKVQGVQEQEDPNAPDVLRAKAERTRLEAERMDAELTLLKIDKLEQRLVKAKNKGDSIDDLQRQLDALQAKIRGEPPPSPTPEAQKKVAMPSTTINREDAPLSSPEALIENMSASVMDQDVMAAARKMATAESNDLTTEEDMKLIPAFLLKVLSSFIGMEVEANDIDSLNKTEFLRRWEMTRNLDYSFIGNYSTPTFTPAELAKVKQDIQGGNSDLQISVRMIEKAGGNATQLALYALEYEKYIDTFASKVVQMPIQEITPEFFQELLNQTSADALFMSLYPKCTRKEGEEPTQAQVDSLFRTVLPAIKFSSSSKPQKVAGGFVMKGTHKYKTGDELIDAIDRELARTPLFGKLTVLYAPGANYQEFNASTVASESIESLTQRAFDLDDLDDLDSDPDPILYITGPDIVRESNRLGLTVTSILGVATSWYLSIYPFLLNEGIGRRVDQQLELLEANLQPDLTWLTDLSFPLFISFIALQLVHEAAHRLVAASNGVKLTVPTFVPSLITGITSSVTTFKTLPKNNEAMFDISASGPLAGIVASLVSLAVGSKLTLISDPSTLPALPLDILRQSTLGGAIIDNIIQGSLYVPEGAPTTGIMISLHPVAIAGYISLVVNALSLLPIGTTDGGRLTMALFDRSGKNAIGSLTLLALLYFGLFGSDLFLFYFSFVIAFQTGNEIPARNEQDPVSFSRVIVATIAYALVIVSLAPFK